MPTKKLDQLKKNKNKRKKYIYILLAHWPITGKQNREKRNKKKKLKVLLTIIYC